MGFADRYVGAIGSTNLLDDVFHHQTEPLAAAALAGDIGALLCRVKFADGTINRMFEGNQQNMVQLIRIWTNVVIEKGSARRWVKNEDIQIAHGLYKRVAEASLAHWLDSNCKACAGTGVMALMGNRVCTVCKGSRAAEITHLSGYEKKLALDMVSEMTALYDSHARRASAKLRE
jgi:hypothetical protein